MNVTLPIPDELAARLGDAEDLTRRALEAFAADEYRAGRLSQPELRSLLGFATLGFATLGFATLGFATHGEVDGFLRNRGIFEDYTQQDLDRERRTLDHLGL